MKRFGITFLATLVLGIFTIQANTNEGVSNENKTATNIKLENTTDFETIKVPARVPEGLKNAVMAELNYPEYAQNKNLEGQVYMRITIDHNSKVKIVGMNATTPYLGTYVKKELGDVKVKNPGCKPGQVYLMKVNFDLLN